MNKQVFIILANTDNDPFMPARIDNNNNKSYYLENQFGFFDDFSYNMVRRFEQINTLPKDSIKLFLNPCSMPYEHSTNLSPSIVDYINKTDNCYMWIFSPHEAVLYDGALVAFLRNTKIDTNKVILTNSDDTLIKTKYLDVKCCSMPEWWEAYYRYNLYTLNDASFISPEEKYNSLHLTDKKFISLNRNVKPHRLWFYQALLDTNAVSQGYVSYHLPSVAKIYQEDLRVLITNYFKKDKDLANKMINNRKMFKSRELDALDDKHVINYQSSIREYFLKSLVNFNTESHAHSTFITEKTFKCITHSQPFILVGKQEISAKLKERGYKTYESIFGEEVINKYSTAVNILENFNRISIDTLREKVKKSWDIVEYNWNHFHNRKIEFQPLLDNIVWMINNG